LLTLAALPLFLFLRGHLDGQNAPSRREAAGGQTARSFHGNAGEFVPGGPTKSSGCAINGVFPDKDCTPGAVMGISKEEICNSSTKSRRHVTSRTKQQVFAAYGISDPQPKGDYEVDHFIPLELGGSNDVANLWPEPAKPAPGFHEKDKVETALHDKVCKAGMDLAEAQRTIATDWLAYYRDQMGGK
jgi:hypothetical protein